jgi:hypothetical protein
VQERIPINTATDNYTCDGRLTAAGKVHCIHEGRVVKPIVEGCIYIPSLPFQIIVLRYVNCCYSLS